MPKPGPRSTYRYSDEFKATAVKLSQLPGVLVNDDELNRSGFLGGSFT